MSKRSRVEFKYILKDDYDSKCKVNHDDVFSYSKSKLDDLYPNNEYEIIGETFEKNKRDYKTNVGKVELNDKILYVSEYKKHSRLFKKEKDYIEVEGGFIALLKTRILPIIIIVALLLAGIGFGGWCYYNSKKPVDPIDPIDPVDPDIVTVSGNVYYGDALAKDVTVILYIGDTEYMKTKTDENGKYLFADVANNNYNIVASYQNSQVNRLITVSNVFVTIDLHISDKNLKVSVDIADEKTPNIAVGNLEKEAEKYIIDGKKVEITFVATKLDENKMDPEIKADITKYSEDLNYSFFDFSIYKEVFTLAGVKETSEGLYETENVLEIAIPYDSTYDIGTYVFRSHNGEATKFNELDGRPSNNYQDGTYYVANYYVYIYANKFSTYAIGSALSSGKKTKGEAVITYSNTVKVNLNTKEIQMYYVHGKESDSNVRVELYLVGKTENYLISTSDIVQVGKTLNKMKLMDDLTKLPGVGTYQGIMKLVFLSNDSSQQSVNIDIDVRITLYK